MPKISVIIPVYNTEKYLAECLDSVLNQTFTDWEAICIDDGSTDNSLEILKEYAKKDKRIKILTQKNQGLSATRNRGIKIATGKYISFIDSDDKIDKNFYSVLFESAEKYNADIAVAEMKIVNKTDIQTNTIKKFITNKFSNKIKYFNNGSVCDKIFKKTLFDNISFPVGMYYEDNIVLTKCAYMSNIVVFIPQTSYFYIMHDNSICRDQSPEKQLKKNKDKMFIIKQIVTFAKEHHISGIDLLELKFFLSRTIAEDFCHKKSEYYAIMKQLLGTKFLFYKKSIRLITKLHKFLFRSQNDTIKIFKIPVYHKKQKYDAIYSIGYNCGCAQNLKRFKIRKTSGPFDWLYCDNLNKVFDVLLSDFKDFLNVEDLVPMPKNPDAKLVDKEHDYYRNAKNTYVFLHDFPANVSLQDSFSQVKEKYERRIKRFLDMVYSDKSVLLVYISFEKELDNQLLINLCSKYIRHTGKNIHFCFIENSNNKNQPTQKTTLSKNVTKYTTFINLSKDRVSGSRANFKHIFKHIHLKK